MSQNSMENYGLRDKQGSKNIAFSHSSMHDSSSRPGEVAINNSISGEKQPSYYGDQHDYNQQAKQTSKSPTARGSRFVTAASSSAQNV